MYRENCCWCRGSNLNEDAFLELLNHENVGFSPLMSTDTAKLVLYIALILLESSTFSSYSFFHDKLFFFKYNQCLPKLSMSNVLAYMFCSLSCDWLLGEISEFSMSQISHFLAVLNQE